MIAYLAVTSGVIVNSHFCMDKLDSTQLFATSSKVCGKCGMHTDKSHGCCRDEVKILKVDSDQKLNPVLNFEIPSLEAIVMIPSEFIITSFYNAPKSPIYFTHSPPLIGAQDTYLQNRSFRI